MQDILRTLQEVQTGTKGEDLQAELHQVDEPAQLFHDSFAFGRKLGCPDNLSQTLVSFDPIIVVVETAAHLAQAALILVLRNAVGQSFDLFRYELDYRLLLL